MSFPFGIGTTLVHFHILGNVPFLIQMLHTVLSPIEQLNMLLPSACRLKCYLSTSLDNIKWAEKLHAQLWPHYWGPQGTCHGWVCFIFLVTKCVCVCVCVCVTVCMCVHFLQVLLPMVHVPFCLLLQLSHQNLGHINFISLMYILLCLFSHCICDWKKKNRTKELLKLLFEGIACHELSE